MLKLAERKFSVGISFARETETASVEIHSAAQKD